MKVTIKQGAGGCTGHGRCAVLAGEVYELDDDGYNLHQGSTLDVPVGKEEPARVGAASCPERAIVVED